MKNVNFTANEETLLQLQELQNAWGEHNKSAVFRQCIRKAHETEFGKNRKRTDFRQTTLFTAGQSKGKQ